MTYVRPSEYSNILVLVACVVLCSVFTLAKRLYTRFFHLQKFSGPPLAAWSRWWLLRAYASQDSAYRLVEVNKRYGPLARIGPNHILTDDPDVQFRILEAKSPYLRGQWFDSLRFDPHYTSIASERDVSKHDKLRKTVAAGYQTRDFPDLESVVNTRITKWLESVDQDWLSAPGETKKIDFARSIRWFTLDIAAFICFSRDLGFDDTKEIDAFWDSMEENAPYGQYLSALPELFKLIYNISLVPAFKKNLILTEHNNPGVGKVIRISRIVTEERFKPNAKPVNDMLGSWIKHGLDQHSCETEVAIALVTGAFPTAVALIVTLLHVVQNPLILAKLRKEIDQAAFEGRLSSPVENQEAAKLPYLQAVISEGLRKWSPITQLRERVTPPEGDTINGRFIPGGVNIGLNAWGLQLNECYEPDPEVFRPERWLEASGDKLARMQKVHSLIFGYGSTKCLGIPQASMIFNKVLVELLRNYDVTVLDPVRPWHDNNSGVSFISQFWCRITKREALTPQA